ncbi:MAG: hypothetical protein K9G46_07005 [Flavobacteriales bacterium]|jgi:hypothetical protein|nr:hypothetical protein [Flavobacteriales bacterium]
MKPPKKTRFLPPYKKSGRTTFPESNGRKGVYLIKLDGKLSYVGFSGSDLYKALYRHFQEWNDRRAPRVVYPPDLRDRCTVRVVYCNTAAQAAKLEKALILFHQPKDNPDKLERYQLSLADAPAFGQMLDDYEEAEFIPPTEVPF